uniref:CRAL-TRIO domain-containing protein n=1 Tax=Araucaria cunninghamii TaxID=56994 RepID=A0A0D6QVK0_ARACU
MMMSKKNGAKGHETPLSPAEEQAKITELRALLGSLSGKLLLFCSDAALSRYLRARNWNVKKAAKMLKETLKWRLEYKPEEIRWEDIAHEAETGKIYRANYVDKYGRTVLVMRPGCQNTTSWKGQIKYLVYCMENAIINLQPDQEQMVWLIDFKGWSAGSISVKVTRETANVLQNQYPERLGLAILYNPPKIFESFWTVVKPFLEPKTYRKVKFVYSKDSESMKIMDEVFDMDKVESVFGGRSAVEFSKDEYGQRMQEDDKKTVSYWSSAVSLTSSNNLVETLLLLDPPNFESGSDSEKDDKNLESVDLASGSDGSPEVFVKDSACSGSGPNGSAKVDIDLDPHKIESAINNSS